MCIIIAKPKDAKLPPKEHFLNSESKNSDGVGVAINNGKLMTTIKKDFLDAEECYEYLKKNTTSEDIVIIHFRWGTSGVNTEEYRHPYPISHLVKDMKKTECKSIKVVAHNGVLTNYDPETLETNDTMEFIRQLLSKSVIKNNLKNSTIRKLLEEHIAGDKLAIIDEGSLYLIGDFEKDNGVFYSNKDYKYSYKPVVYSSPSYNYGYKDECEYCSSLKRVASMYHNHSTYRLCRNCRRKVKKGTLTFDEIDVAYASNYSQGY